MQIPSHVSVVGGSSSLLPCNILSRNIKWRKQPRGSGWRTSLSVDAFVQPFARRLFHQRWLRTKKKKKGSGKFQPMFWSHIYYLALRPLSRLWRHLNASLANSHIFRPICDISFPHQPQHALHFWCARCCFMCVSMRVSAGFNLQQRYRRNYVKWQHSMLINGTSVFWSSSNKNSPPVSVSSCMIQWCIREQEDICSSLARMLCPPDRESSLSAPIFFFFFCLCCRLRDFDPLNMWRILLGKKERSDKGRGIAFYGQIRRGAASTRMLRKKKERLG